MTQAKEWDAKFVFLSRNELGKKKQRKPIYSSIWPWKLIWLAVLSRCFFICYVAQD
jgi:hypothetical protein